MVWIHGGGLEFGSASTPLYHGDVLATHGVIVASFNYRLGVLGFLAFPDLSAESPNHTSGNYGLLDQVAALNWVHRNIAAFGGDPNNVTLFGQSSGAISISVLSIMPSTAGLFRRAIGQSGGLFEPLELADDFTLPGAERAGVDFAMETGARALEELRALPADALLRARFVPHFVVDGHDLPESPFAAYSANRNHALDLLVGFNADDGAWALDGRNVTAASLSTVLSKDFPSWLVFLIGPSDPASDVDAYRASAAFERDMRFAWDMTIWARLHAAQGNGTTYFYRFGGADGRSNRGTHGSELPFVFGHAPPAGSWSEADWNLSTQMASYWTHFAGTGNPNESGFERWNTYLTAGESTIELGEPPLGRGERSDLDFVPRIDAVYKTVRFVAAHEVLVGTGLAAIVLATLLLLVRKIVRRGRHIAQNRALARVRSER